MFGLTLAFVVTSGAVGATEVRVAAGFYYSPEKRVERVAEDHYVVHIGRQFCNWFLLRIEGAKGRTLTIDLRDAPLRKWKTLNPVYSYVEDIGALDSFVCRPVRAPFKPRHASNGPMLPDTRGQRWHFIEDVRAEGDALRLRQRFEPDSAWLAMKYPYTCEYNERFLQKLGGLKRPDVEIIEIARSKEGRSIKLVKIGTGGEDRKPCVLIYAREHPTEHDTSWVCEGAILFLLSNTREARAMRSRFTFLVIPVLDPDGAVRSQYQNIMATFASGLSSPESLAVSAWFRKWVDRGKRLDLAISLHNVESNEARRLVCAIMEPERLEHCEAFHGAVLGAMKGFDLAREPWQRGYRLFRLAGFVGRHYGALPMYYEVNSQAPSRHLTLRELREMGARFVLAAAGYFASSDGRKLLAAVGQRRRERVTRWRSYGHLFKDTDALYSEEWCSIMPKVERLHREKGYDVAWMQRKRK